MQFIGSFSTFNPISGNFSAKRIKSHINIDLPGNSVSFPLILDLIAERARKIITGRKEKEIDAAINTINYILYLSVNKQLPFSDETDVEHIADRHVHELSIENSSTPAQLLKSQIPSYDIKKDAQFRNAKWGDYFAILALAALGDIHRFHKLDGELSGASVGLAAESMEALIIAENPSLFTHELNRPIRDQISIQNQKNAIQGHAVRNQLKQEFWHWVYIEYVPKLNGRRFNKRRAARQFKAEVLDPRLTKRRIGELERRDLIRILADSLAENRRFSKT